MKSHAGSRNLITDVAGLKVGNAQDDQLKSGVTVLIPDKPAVAAVQVLGGAPGTRETDAMAPHNTVREFHGLVLSGGSAFGLDAASGAQAAMREQGIGIEVAGHRVPVVPAAILFDLANGGNKDWGLYPPYREMGYQAARSVGLDFGLGSVGAGTGALTAGLKGGLGSASTVLPNGVTVGALVAANPLGSVTMGDTHHFWASPFELEDEFGGHGLPSPVPADAAQIRYKYHALNAATTIGVIATDAVLTKAETKRLAVAAHDGFVRSIWPAHTPGDGDLVFGMATGAKEIVPDFPMMMDLAAVAASTMARAIARAVYFATPAKDDVFPTWSQRFG